MAGMAEWRLNLRIYFRSRNREAAAQSISTGGGQTAGRVLGYNPAPRDQGGGPPSVRVRQMTARKTWLNGLAASGVSLVLVTALAPVASAQTDQPKSRKERAAAAQAAEAEAPKADYSKEFRKLAGPVQTAVNEKKWADVLAALPCARGAARADARRPEGDRDLAPAGDAGRRRPGCLRGRNRGIPCRGLCGARERRCHAPPARRALQREGRQGKDAGEFPEVRGWNARRRARRVRNPGAALPPGRQGRRGLPVPRQGHRFDREPRTSRRRNCGSSCATSASLH